MKDGLNIIAAMEGLPPQDVRTLTDRIKQATIREIENFKKGETTMTEPNLNEVLEGLSYDELLEAIQAYKQPKVEAREQQTQQAKQLDEQEAQEIAALVGSGERGHNFAVQKKNITVRYTALRNAKPPEVDAELEAAAKKGTYELHQLYRQRLNTIQRGDPLALRKKTEIASPFREKGLNV